MGVFFFLAMLFIQDGIAADLSCDKVCRGEETFIQHQLKEQMNVLFVPKSTCRLESDSQITLTENQRSLSLGAKVAAARLGLSCDSNLTLNEDLSSDLIAKGSSGFLKQALAGAGLLQSDSCFERVEDISALRAGDVLRVGLQSLILENVGEDPFGYEVHLQMGLPEALVQEKSKEKARERASQLCREWLADTSQYHLQIMFLSVRNTRQVEIKRGSWDSLMGGDQSSNLWNAIVQEQAEGACVKDVLASLGIKERSPAKRGASGLASLSIQRYATGVSRCRTRLEPVFQGVAGACARCCLAKGEKK